MSDKHGESSAKWKKGAIAGGIWGTSEMSLGSLLHNLTIPFAGYILVSIAIVLMSGINVRWKMKGLFYRAGLTSALLKFFSPSPVILPPAISISIEGFLMEAGVFVFGANPLGFAVGGGLALSWLILFKFIKLLTMYGANIYILYTMLFDKAVAFAGIKELTPAAGIVILVMIYFSCGALYSLAGSWLGSRIKDDDPHFSPVTSVPEIKNERSNDSLQVKENSASLYWLAGNVIIAIMALFFIGSYPEETIPFLAIYCVFAMIRYKHALKKVMQFKFLAPIIGVTLLTGIFVTGAHTGYLSFQALAGGLQLMFRAWLMVLVFRGIMFEMNHPSIAGYIRRKYGDKFSGTVDLAWQTNSALSPSVSQAKIVKNPLGVFRSVVLTAEDMLSDVKARVVIVKGAIDAGKTKFIRSEAARLKEYHSVCGFYCDAVKREDVKTEYILTDVVTGNRVPFCKRKITGGFHFSEDAVGYGEDLILPRLGTAEYVFIDEAGRLEFENRGWHRIIEEALKCDLTLVVSVRDIFVDDFMRHYGLRRAMVADAAVCTAGENK